MVCGGFEVSWCFKGSGYGHMTVCVRTLVEECVDLPVRFVHRHSRIQQYPLGIPIQGSARPRAADAFCFALLFVGLFFALFELIILSQNRFFIRSRTRSCFLLNETLPFVRLGENLRTMGVQID